MNEIDFRNWLKQNGTPQKVQGDYISRIKRLERTIHVDLDEQYAQDQCESILLIFLNKGENSEMQKYMPNSLPIGKYYMSTYKLAVKKYAQFLDSISEARK